MQKKKKVLGSCYLFLRCSESLMLSSSSLLTPLAVLNLPPEIERDWVEKEQKEMKNTNVFSFTYSYELLSISSTVRQASDTATVQNTQIKK